MRYKLEIDPITNRVNSISKVTESLKIYEDDVLVDEKDIQGIDVRKPITYIEGKLLNDENKTEIEILEAQKCEFEQETEQEFFMRLVINQEESLEIARKQIGQRRKKNEALKEAIEGKRKEQKEKAQKYYLDLDRKKDEMLNFQYYSAVIMVIKNENRYLKEWLDWHLRLGFDCIYLYDNGTEEKVTEITTTYPGDIQRRISVVDWSGHHTHIQQNAYEHFLNNFKQQVRWGIFIDSDEFVRFTDGKTTSVNDFLKDYEDYTEIWGYEVEYDANGQECYENRPVRERFTQRTSVREGVYWKNFVQVNRISGWLMHYAKYNMKKHFLYKNEEMNKDLFVIDHYYTKSWEEWQWKIKKRGGADPKYHKALREFFFYNPDMKYLDTGDDSIQGYEEV